MSLREYVYKIHYGKKVYQIETIQLICTANQLNSFYMIRGFAERSFKIDYISVLINLFIYLFTYSFIHLLIYLDIVCLFIYLFVVDTN